jgi:hypothetical protein
MRHPYRQSGRPGDEDRPRIDPEALEERAVQGVLAAVGLLGVVVGFAWHRPTELAVGGLVLLGVIWTSRTPPA